MTNIWMPIYWGDYTKKTSSLTLEQHGAYLMLLKEYWNTGMPLPADKNKLYRSCGAFSQTEQQAIDFILKEYFVEHEGFYLNSRIEIELNNAKKNKELQSNRTKAATEARKLKQLRNDNDTNNVTLKSTNNVTFTPSPSPSPSPLSSTTTDKDKSLFELFYVRYPKKRNPVVAEKAFYKALKIDTPENIMAGLEQYIAEIKLLGTDTQFIKHPGPWLNAGGWKNEYQTTKQSKPMGNKYGKPTFGDMLSELAGARQVNKNAFSEEGFIEGEYTSPEGGEGAAEQMLFDAKA